MDQLENITGIILCGGKSSRMGSDKGLSLLYGKELVLHIIDVLRPVFKHIILVANNPGYTKFDLPVFPDLVKDTGPIGGIYSGLKTSGTEWNFIIACDMPFISQQTIRSLYNTGLEKDITIPIHNNSLEPACAFYNKSSLPVIEKQLQLGQYKLQDLIRNLSAKVVELNNEIDAGENPFRNINTSEELIKLNRS